MNSFERTKNFSSAEFLDKISHKQEFYVSWNAEI